MLSSLSPALVRHEAARIDMEIAPKAICAPLCPIGGEAAVRRIAPPATVMMITTEWEEQKDGMRPVYAEIMALRTEIHK